MQGSAKVDSVTKVMNDINGQCPKPPLATENLLENTDGVLHGCSLGAAACYLLVMLTRAVLMPSLFQRHLEQAFAAEEPERTRQMPAAVGAALRQAERGGGRTLRRHFPKADCNYYRQSSKSRVLWSVTNALPSTSPAAVRVGDVFGSARCWGGRGSRGAGEEASDRELGQLSLSLSLRYLPVCALVLTRRRSNIDDVIVCVSVKVKCMH